MTEESAVKVCIRVRPPIQREENAALESLEPVQFFWKAEKKSVHLVDEGNTTKSFSFDRVITAEETTVDLYQDIAKPLVVSTVEGYNGTIFAYGQTSSGKTFTMMGSEHLPGVIPMAVEDVFQTIKNCPKKEFLLRVSYMEIYNETVTDLLVDSWKRKPLEVREAMNKNVYVAELTEELVTSPAQALAWIRKGEKNRHYGKTKMNQRSSRSHTIFRMILESRQRSDPVTGESADGAIIVSHLNLVDLAGSERASQTGAEGARFKEGCNINRSLFILGQVIKKLTDEGQKGFTNYRDSKLTRILQNSLGGNAKTVIICTITPVTMDETLSTLQFASTAKKMKNDPHVTEVSDDGALLKRYRNEITDLKRRLQEVSSVTQTTATEKEVLSQLLQEKDQLQREQEDRIKNLTKLLVTSSNQVPVVKMPKRRMTWGGKMLRLARPSTAGGEHPSNQSFAEPFNRKRKADRSCLMTLCEDNEDFDSTWVIPDEPLDDAEASSVGSLCFDDSPKDHLYPERLHELLGNLSNMEMRLELETQQKDEASAKAEMLCNRVAELEQQLQQWEQGRELQAEAEAQKKHQASAETETMETQPDNETVKMLEIRVADLEKQLEDQSHIQTESNEQMRQFEETIQLCEALASEKEEVACERDYLKQELGMFLEQISSLEKENATLALELKEKRETDEFKSLEEEFRNEHENELKNEIASLKKASEASEVQHLELQRKLDSLSEELKKKSDFAEELQNMSGKDLVQEVAKLRRSLDDAEGLSRDTKKEWAVLRSQKISLEETMVTLTTRHDTMEAEVSGLRSQLEAEKSRFRKMQGDLQRELNMAFDENTKLTSLLDGKVPKNLIDSVELERTVNSLTQELAASRKAEEELQARLQELDKVDGLLKQVNDLSEQLSSTEVQRDALLSQQAGSLEEAERLRGALQASGQEVLEVREELGAAALREARLTQQIQEVTQQLALDQEREQADKSRLSAAVHENVLKLQESEQHKASLDQQLREAQQQVKELQEKLVDSESSRATEEEISKELQEQVDLLTEELSGARGQKEQSSAAEEEELLSRLTAERDQLKTELHHNVQMTTEMQVLLQSLREDLQDQKQQNSDLLKLNEQKESEMAALSRDLQEKQTLLATGVRSSAETEELLATIDSLTAERDQLKIDLHENIEMMIENQDDLRSSLDKNRELKEQIKTLEASLSKPEVPQSESDSQLDELQTKLKTLTAELVSLQAERDGLMSAQVHHQGTEELQGQLLLVSQERDQLLEALQSLRQQKQQLQEELEERMEAVAQAHCGFGLLEVQQEQDETVNQKLEELQASLQAVNEQKIRLETDLQQQTEMAANSQSLLQAVQQQLQQENQRTADLKRSNQETQVQLEQQAAETQSRLLSVQEELREARQKSSDQMKLLEKTESNLEQQTRTLTEQLTSVRAERDSLLLLLQQKDVGGLESTEELLSRVASVSQERDQLLEALGALREEKQQLRAELEDRMKTMQELEKSREELSQLKSDLQEKVELTIRNQEELRVSDEKVTLLQDELNTLRRQHAEVEGGAASRELQNQIQSLNEQLEGLKAQRAAKALNHSVETEELLNRVMSATQERDLLQEALEGLTQEREQQRAELEAGMEKLRAEVAVLSSTLQAEADRKKQLEEELQQSRDEVFRTQETLDLVQEELSEQKLLIFELQTRSKERQSSLDRQCEELSEKLQAVQAEREELLRQMESSIQETEELRSRATSVSLENGALEGRLQGLRQEKEQLQAELKDKMKELHTQISAQTGVMESLRQEKQQLQGAVEDRMGKILAMQEKLSEQEKVITLLQAKKQEREAELKQEVLQLEKSLQKVREEQAQAEAQTATSTQQQSSPGTATVAATTLSQLDESAEQLQEWFRKLQWFEDNCSRYLRVLNSAPAEENAVPVDSTAEAIAIINQQLRQETQKLKGIVEYLQKQAHVCRKLFEELINKDLAVYEEMRLRDLLLCRAQAPGFSVREADFADVWELRLVELLERRRSFLNQMSDVWEKLRASMSSMASVVSAELQEQDHLMDLFDKKMTAASASKQPDNSAALDDSLRAAQERRSVALRARHATLQAITEEHNSLLQELKRQEAQAQSRLQEERSKNATLLQPLEGAPLKTEPSLLRDNQQLVDTLQQTEAQVKALRVKVAQLEEAWTKADSRVSTHKQATQLLQTELQDSRAQVDEKEKAIQSLRNKLRESEKNASPSAVELEELRSSLFKVQTELTVATEKHQQEVQQINTLLGYKEESLRKVKETLRKKSQQDGNESFHEGKEIYAKLTMPKGRLITSSLSMEKQKLEEEVQQLRMKIVQLESLVASQAAEVSKWKGRAIKLKGKPNVDPAKPSSPSTPTKRGLAGTSDLSSFLNSPKKFLVTPKKVLQSPRKVLDSPKRSLDSPKSSCQDSPKSRFFGVGDCPDMLIRTCPKQFFDNSGLGSLPETVPEASPTLDTETGATALSEDQRDSWPKSDKQEDICKTQ